MFGDYILNMQNIGLSRFHRKVNATWPRPAKHPKTPRIHPDELSKTLEAKELTLPLANQTWGEMGVPVGMAENTWVTWCFFNPLIGGGFK